MPSASVIAVTLVQDQFPATFRLAILTFPKQSCVILGYRCRSGLEQSELATAADNVTFRSLF